MPPKKEKGKGDKPKKKKSEENEPVVLMPVDEKVVGGGNEQCNNQSLFNRATGTGKCNLRECKCEYFVGMTCEFLVLLIS